MKQHPPGLLALSCSESSRFSVCNASREGIVRPAGSLTYTACSLSIAENWNHVVSKVLLLHSKLEWIFFMNDDHIYPPDVLIRLLDHELDAVTGLYCEKVVPFGPILYDTVDEDGLLTRLDLSKAATSLEHTIDHTCPIVACGDGALLVRRRVFERIDPPWWTFGEVEADKADHDVSFCRRLRDAGVKLHADLSVIVDHVTPIALRPCAQPDGSWSVALRDRQGSAVEIGIVAAPAPREVSV